MKQTQASFAPSSTPLGPVDVTRMAALLIDKHGKHAVDVADFMANEYAAYKDLSRQMAWCAVISVANDMLDGRLYQHRLSIH